MDLELFARVIRNILHVQVLRPSQERAAYIDFERMYCYDPVLQPAFRAEALRELVEAMEDGVIYDAQGQIGTCIVFFRFQGEAFVVGPFVRREFDEANIQTVLMAHRIPASVAASIRLYYSAFPMVSITRLRDVIMSTIQAFTASTEEYRVQRLETGKSGEISMHSYRADALDYSSVYRHYELEDAFLHDVETGNTENVLMSFGQMNLDTMKRDRYVNAIFQNPVIGLSMVRVLARKAAERGGASPIEVHNITQQAAQKIFASTDMEQQIHFTADMLLELTETVKRARLSLGRYSPDIRHIIEYLRINFSQEVSSADLARLVNLSESYFTRRFKKEVGMTVARYIARLRCEEAAHLLRTGDTPIQTISMFVGYPDNNYFVKIFRANYGVTPSDYRAGKNTSDANLVR